MFKWFKKKEEPKIQYKVVEVPVEADELEGEVTLHLVDGTILKYKNYGYWSPYWVNYDLITGKASDYIFIKNKYQKYIVSITNYCLPTIINDQCGQNNGKIQYLDEQNIQVTVNSHHIIQESINIKPTGKKVTSYYEKLEKIE